jgi:hypothetical protein
MQHAARSVRRTGLCRIAPAQLGLELRDARRLRGGHTAQLRERPRAVGCAQAYTECTTAQRSMLCRCASACIGAAACRARRDAPTVKDQRKHTERNHAACGV